MRCRCASSWTRAVMVVASVSGSSGWYARGSVASFIAAGVSGVGGQPGNFVYDGHVFFGYVAYDGAEVPRKNQVFDGWVGDEQVGVVDVLVWY